jgi:hypothetical protein
VRIFSTPSHGSESRGGPKSLIEPSGPASPLIVADQDQLRSTKCRLRILRRDCTHILIHNSKMPKNLRQSRGSHPGRVQGSSQCRRRRCKLTPQLSGTAGELRGPSRLAESPPAAAPKNAPAAMMPSPPSPAVAEGPADAARAHPDTACGCPPPAGATPRGAEPDEAASATPAPTVVPESSHSEGPATSHGKGSATSHGEAPATSHGEASATSHGKASAAAMPKAAGPCEAPATVRPTAAHGRCIQCS